MTLFIYVFVVISSTLYAGSVILETVIGWNLWTSSLSLIIATGIYVTLGGLKAIVWTENIQCIILLIGGLILMTFSLINVGGINGLSDFYQNISNTDKRDNMHMFRSYKDSEWPWPGIIFGIICNSYYYWVGQHLIVQRILASKSPLHARLGCIITSILKILPVFIMVIPGMCAIKLYPNEFSNGTSKEYDRAYPLMVINILPNGLIGIVIASMLSALMSSLAAVYNSAATIIVNDIYKLYDPNISDTKSVKIGRIGACLFVIFSVLWLPNIENNKSELFIYTQQVISYVNSPLSCVYVFGHFWNRANVYGAYSALCIGFLFGIPRFVFGIILDNQYCRNVFCESNYLYFAIFLFVACSIGMIIASLITNPPNDEQINGMTYWTMKVKKMQNNNDLNEVSMSNLSIDVDGGDKQTQKNDPILPLIQGITEKSTTLCQKFKDYFLNFMRLEGDESNRKWNKMANVLFIISFIINIAMWIWFR